MPFTLFNIYEKIPSVYGAYSVYIPSVQLSLSCVVDVDQGSLIIQYRKARINKCEEYCISCIHYLCQK